MSANAFAEFLCDALQPLGPVIAKRMFSGSGLFCDGLMFGLIFGDTLYLKADADSQRAFAAEGQSPFVYEARGRQVAVGYWRAPERLLDEPDVLVDWARTALDVAQRAARAKARRNAGTSRPEPPVQGGDKSRAAARRTGARRPQPRKPQD